MKMEGHVSHPLSLTTGGILGCVLFTPIYTNNFISGRPSVKPLKYVADTIPTGSRFDDNDYFVFAKHP